MVLLLLYLIGGFVTGAYQLGRFHGGNDPSSHWLDVAMCVTAAAICWPLYLAFALLMLLTGERS
jgi:hypothetical protein